MLLKEPVFIILPVHNRKAVTLSCLENLEKNGDLTHYQVVVVDDGSTDGTEQAIHQQYPEVTVLKGDGNLWWTGAIVQGMQFAIDQGAEWVIWLNDDCILSEGSLSRLVEFCRTHPHAIAGTACYLAAPRTLHVSGARGRQRLAAKPGEVVAVDEMSGHCVCIPRAVVDRIGLPNAEKFPHYHGDSMYILKASRSGFSAYILGDAQLEHAGVIKSSVSDFMDLTKSDQSIVQSFKTVFLHQKSFYFLPTQFFYYQEKYGFLVGTPLFFAKVLGWLWQFMNHFFQAQIIRNSH